MLILKKISVLVECIAHLTCVFFDDQASWVTRLKDKFRDKRRGKDPLDEEQLYAKCRRKTGGPQGPIEPVRRTLVRPIQCFYVK